ncbi:MAG: hypothetical protein Q4G35_04370 [Propionibacteriaceae bacterium]|nr:hypothetical protein [Propionibacteriaceae bacterium]
MSDAEERAVTAYNTITDAHADYFQGTEAELPVDRAMIEHFISLLPTAPRVLDAGCGWEARVGTVCRA